MGVLFTEMGRVPGRRWWHIFGERTVYSVLAVLILRYWFRHQVKDTEKASVSTNLDHRGEVLSRHMSCWNIAEI